MRFADVRAGGRTTSSTTWRRFGAYLVITELGIALVLLVDKGLGAAGFTFNASYSSVQDVLVTNGSTDIARTSMRPLLA